MAAATILGGTTVALIQCSGTVLKRRSAGVIRRKMANFFTVNPDLPIIPVKEARRFVKDCLEAVGTPYEHASAMADILVEADYRGHYSHGMNRLEMYVKDIQHGTTAPAAKPKILKEGPATAWVDGNNGLGGVVGDFSMQLAIKKAKDSGVGWVATKGSNHYGIAAWYGLQALKEGLLGMSFTNTSPLLAPTRSKQAALGTNPICLVAPAKDGDSFQLDMATSAVALGKIEIQRRKGERMPFGWAQDKNGKVTDDPKAAYEARCLMPLGGEEKNSGYKGSGLALMVEVFCGILAGATYGPNIRRWGDSTKSADLGQCFVAIDPKCFAPDFEGRMSDIMNIIRNLEASNCEKPVWVAGDQERYYKAFVDKIGGVQYVKDQLETCKKLANKLHVNPLQPLKK